ncbi:helveticin J family class III bacteriocin [Lactobacillus sp. R2/2]|nr:helveticin J family class III bacteriocin [Lactobacillus sp. R2/2]
MRKVSSVTPSLKYELNGLHQVVVQKGNVATKYIYALQQLAKGTDTVVYRARKDGFNAQFTKGEKHFRLFLKGAKRVVQQVLIHKLGNMLDLTAMVSGLLVQNLKNFQALNITGLLK